MKRIGMLCTLAVFLVTTLVTAGESHPELYAVRAVKANPTGLIRYEQALKTAMAAYGKHGLAVDFIWVESTDNLVYYFIIPIQSMGDMDGIMRAFADVRKKMGPNALAEMEQAFAGTADTSEIMVVKKLDTLSYTGEEPPEGEKWRYFEETLWYIQPDKYQEAMAIAADYRKLFEEKQAKVGYTLFMKTIGSDMPMMYVVTMARDPLHFAQREAELKKLLGDAVKPLQERFLSVTRKMEVNRGWGRPDLSYLPKADTATPATD